jgi:phosphoribosylformimino-5-aminoimidazole carboxamide ribotide isomerase
VLNIAIMRVIPVIDLLGGVVVHAVGGRREEYRPIVSRLTSSVKPGDLARAFTERFGFRELYVADLDAIAGQSLNRKALDDLRSLGFSLWVDGGIKDCSTARQVAELADTAVVGLETLEGPDKLEAMLDEQPVQRLVLSLDLRAGQPLGNRTAWGTALPKTIATRALALGVRRFLVLDLACVGDVGTGPSSPKLCEWLVSQPGCVEVTAGGGVRGPKDLRMLRGIGVEAALVASALHDGRIAPGDLDDLT